MVTEINLWTVKTRIKDILENDTTLNAYFRNFQVGAPNENLPEQCPLPFMFITNDEGLIMEDEEWHVENDAPTTSKQTMHFMVAFMAKGKNGPKTEKELDDIGVTIKKVLKENYHLKDPVALNDPMAFRAYPGELRGLNQNMIGKEVQGRVLMLEVIQYTS